MNLPIGEHAPEGGRNDQNARPASIRLSGRLQSETAAGFAGIRTHYGGLELFSLSPLFGAIISANVFLIGFLISGVLVDYKESERLPGELACSLKPR